MKSTKRVAVRSKAAAPPPLTFSGWPGSRVRRMPRAVLVQRLIKIFGTLAGTTRKREFLRPAGRLELSIFRRGIVAKKKSRLRAGIAEDTSNGEHRPDGLSSTDVADLRGAIICSQLPWIPRDAAAHVPRPAIFPAYCQSTRAERRITAGKFTISSLVKRFHADGPLLPAAIFSSSLLPLLSLSLPVFATKRSKVELGGTPGSKTSFAVL